MTRLRPLTWNESKLTLLDQRLLPAEIIYMDCNRMDDVREAIVTLAVRGAPLIGVVAAYAMILAWRESVADPSDTKTVWRQKAQHLAAARPTAVNLRWAVEKMYRIGLDSILRGDNTRETDVLLVGEAQKIELEDIALTHAIGTMGASLFGQPVSILTHCNAGALATAGIGTALGVIRKLHSRGHLHHVFIDETRPLLQGARLTASELCADDIPCTLICDNMAADVIRSGKVDAVIVGADRICANGDTANKIGTYGLAIIAAYHHIPFYIAAPFSTFDFSLKEGKEIIIEERADNEIRYWNTYRTAPAEVAVYNPAFDVTPGALISGIITEKGVLRPPFEISIAQFKEEVGS